MSAPGPRLQNRVVLVTGAGMPSAAGDLGTIGSATARLMASAAADVVIVDMDLAAATRTAETIQATGGRALAVECDVSDRGACARAMEQTISRFGRLDVLVNNAAVTSRMQLADMSVEEWRRVQSVNIEGAMFMSQLALPHLIESGNGSIVNMVSAAAIRGFATPAYAASKGALLALTVDMAGTEGPRGVRVNAIMPGHVYTPMVQRIDGSDRGRRLRVNAAPLRTEGLAEDVAWAALFLAGDESRWITGAMLPVDAGMVASAPLPIFGAINAVAN